MDFDDVGGISKKIWIRDDLSLFQKIFITELKKHKDGCFMSPERLARLMRCIPRHIVNSLAILKKLNIVKKIDYNGSVAWILEKEWM